MDRPLIKCTEFNASDLVFKEMEKSDRDNYFANVDTNLNGQICKVNYQISNLDVNNYNGRKTTIYGINLKSKYYEPDKGKETLNIILDPKKKQHASFLEKLSELNDHMKSEVVKKKIFGKQYNKYAKLIFCDIKCENTEVENSKDPSNPYINPPVLKLKFNIDRKTGQIKTGVYSLEVVDNTKNCRVIEDKTFEELSDLLKNSTNQKCIICLSSVWITSTQYGITWKVVRVEMTPTCSDNTNSDNKLFLDSDDDSDNEGRVAYSKLTIDSDNDVVVSDKSAKKIIDSDDESEDDAPKKQKDTINSKKIVTIDSDSDDSDDDVPPQKTETRQVIADSESDSEESETPPPPVVKTKKTKSKK